MATSPTDLSSSPSIPEPICELIRRLESLTARATVPQLKQWLEQLEITVDDLEPFIDFGSNSYRRNLICEGQWYELLCICWRSGQRSPIHNHAGSTCGLRIMQGRATETLFEMTDCGQVVPTESTAAEVNCICSSQDEQIHQVSNLQAAGQDLITLHIYSPALKQMDTYSLFSSETEIYRPQNDAIFCHYGDCI